MNFFYFPFFFPLLLAFVFSKVDALLNTRVRSRYTKERKKKHIKLMSCPVISSYLCSPSCVRGLGLGACNFELAGDRLAVSMVWARAQVDLAVEMYELDGFFT